MPYRLKPNCRSLRGLLYINILANFRENVKGFFIVGKKKVFSEFMKKSEILKKINGGLNRGSKTKLANMLGVSPSVVTEWFLGSRNPTEKYIKALAKLLGVNESEIQEAFPRANYFFNSPVMIGSPGNNNSVGNSATAKDLELVNAKIEVLQKMLENLDLRLKILEKK